jgi:hypothetical protein
VNSPVSEQVTVYSLGGALLYSVWKAAGEENNRLNLDSLDERIFRMPAVRNIPENPLIM